MALQIYRGTAKTFTATVYSSSVTDITGWAMTLSVKSSTESSETALITKTVGSGITISSELVFTFSFTKSDTLSLTPGKYYIDIQRTDSGSETMVLPPQTFEVLEQVLNAPA